MAADIIQKSGSWYSYGEIRIGQGRDAAKQWLRDNPDHYDLVKHRVKEFLGMIPTDAGGDGANEATEKSESAEEAAAASG